MKSLNSKTRKLIKGSTIMAVGFFVLMSAAMQAQDETPRIKKIYGGFGYFSASADQLNIGNLNKSLTANGYGSVNSLTGSFGGGGAFVVNNFIIGGGGAWLNNSSSVHAGTKINFNGGYGYFSGGYIVYSGKHSIFYPTIGIGGGGYNIALSKGTAPADFSQQINAPAGSVTANAGGLLTNIELTYLYFLNKKGKEGFFIGLKAGYKYSPGTWKMSVNNTELNNSPKLNMNGIYVTIVLGGGGLMN